MEITSGSGPQKDVVAPDTKAVEEGPRRADGVTQLCTFSRPSRVADACAD
jgi:hypothetical protein